MGFFTAFPLAVYTQNTQPSVPDRDKVAAILSQWNWQLLDLFDQPVPGGWPRTGAKGFVARAGDTLVVSIAGTEPNSIGTWFQNFDFPVDGDGAHRGFQAGARIALSAVSDILAARNEPIFLTGHSLGGTVAAMAAMLMGESLLNRILGIYTIGMPRSGNARYRDAYNPRLGARTFRRGKEPPFWPLPACQNRSATTSPTAISGPWAR